MRLSAVPSIEGAPTGYAPEPAARSAAEHGVVDLEAFVLQGLARGRSLRSLSTAVGLPADWLICHVDELLRT